MALENNSHQAENAYNRVLENQFNHRKAAQLGQFDQLDKAHEERVSSESQKAQNAPPPLIKKDLDWYLTKYEKEIIYGSAGFALFVLTLVAMIFVGKSRSNNKNAALECKVSDQSQQSKKLRRELEKAHKQILKQNGMLEELKSATKDQKFHIACAVFGFNPKRLPKKDGLKNLSIIHI